MESCTEVHKYRMESWIRLVYFSTDQCTLKSTLLTELAGTKSKTELESETVLATKLNSNNSYYTASQEAKTL